MTLLLPRTHIDEPLRPVSIVYGVQHLNSMMTRDKLKASDYFDSSIDFYLNWIREDKNSNISSGEGRALNVFELPSKAFKVCVYRYSRGDSISDINDSVANMIELLGFKRSTLANVVLNKDVRRMYERLDLGTLYEYLTLLAFMVSLRLPAKDVLQVLEMVGHAGEDAILDRVAHEFGDNTREIAGQSKFPKVYDPLLEVITSPAEQRPAKLKKYVDGWYKRIKPIYWHNNHQGAEGAYFGYWCFEAALVAMLFNVSDVTLQNHPNYPADMVAHYRSARGLDLESSAQMT